MSFASMLSGLIRSKVRFVVVGGLAAAAHGSSRVTNDLDICYDTADANIRALASVLASWSAYPRGVEKGLSFIMDERTLRSAPILTLTTKEGDIDVLDKIAGVGPASAFSAAEVVDATGAYLLPGVVDPHMHLACVFSDDDFATASRSAAAGPGPEIWRADL